MHGVYGSWLCRDVGMHETRVRMGCGMAVGGYAGAGKAAARATLGSRTDYIGQH